MSGVLACGVRRQEWSGQPQGASGLLAWFDSRAWRVDRVQQRGEGSALAEDVAQQEAGDDAREHGFETHRGGEVSLHRRAQHHAQQRLLQRAKVKGAAASKGRRRQRGGGVDGLRRRRARPPEAGKAGRPAARPPPPRE